MNSLAGTAFQRLESQEVAELTDSRNPFNPFTKTKMKTLIIKASIVAGSALLLLILALSLGRDERTDDWMRVMALTDEQVANEAESQACRETILQNDARNAEITAEKESIKSTLWDFQSGTR